MRLKIDFNNPIIPEEKVLLLTTDDLDTAYSSMSETDKVNLFFVLLATLHDLEKKKEVEKGAYMCYLIAYYLFTPLTPPGSFELAMYYASKAVEYMPIPKYVEWLSYIEHGN